MVFQNSLSPLSFPQLTKIFQNYWSNFLKMHQSLLSEFKKTAL